MSYGPDITQGIPRHSLMCCVVVDGHGRTTEPTQIPALPGSTDPVRIAQHYRSEGADVIFADIWDTWGNLGRVLRLVEGLSATGLSVIASIDNGALPSIEQAQEVLDVGAFAIAVNTTAVDDPQLVTAAARTLGGQHFVGVINVTTSPEGTWDVRVDGGRRPTGKHPAQWAAELSTLGIGSLVINDMDHETDGGGFNMPLLQAILRTTGVPVICGGGSRSPQDLPPALAAGAHGVLVLTQLHDGSHTVGELLDALR
ncbi:HisA/HisF-related TIM barrel protein [Streptomyces xanthochromogenes]|uniref:HisA/HisF-related TIM barrel protein n=1 Tax=Streptomyces xanthochromogenes TaxID=67384 RepID=UPI0037A2E6A4